MAALQLKKIIKSKTKHRRFNFLFNHPLIQVYLLGSINYLITDGHINFFITFKQKDSRESEKGAKNSYGSYPTKLVFEVKNEKKTSDTPIPSEIQKKKSPI
jgi:hypothetical protein